MKKVMALMILQLLIVQMTTKFYLKLIYEEENVDSSDGSVKHQLKVPKDESASERNRRNQKDKGKMFKKAL